MDDYFLQRYWIWQCILIQASCEVLVNSFCHILIKPSELTEFSLHLLCLFGPVFHCVRIFYCMPINNEQRVQVWHWKCRDCVVHCRPLVERVPEGVHIDFLRAERSLYRWQHDDVERIRMAERIASKEGAGVQMHVLEDAGHWVRSQISSPPFCEVGSLLSTLR